jgi:hypothetical protein
MFGCPSLPAEVLSRLKPICFLTFESENEHIYLVIILNNSNLEAVHMSSHLWHGGIHHCSLRRLRGSRRMKPPPGVVEEEEVPPTSPQLSHRMKPHPGAREEERCGDD